MCGDSLTHVDVAKGLGILLTVLGHCLAYAGLTGTRAFATIYAFHMPFFFFMSGYLYKRKEATSYFAGKISRLLLPIAIYQGLNLFIYFALCCIGKEL